MTPETFADTCLATMSEKLDHRTQLGIHGGASFLSAIFRDDAPDAAKSLANMLACYLAVVKFEGVVQGYALGMQEAATSFEERTANAERLAAAGPAIHANIVKEHQELFQTFPAPLELPKELLQAFALEFHLELAKTLTPASASAEGAPSASEDSAG